MHVRYMNMRDDTVIAHAGGPSTLDNSNDVVKLQLQVVDC